MKHSRRWLLFEQHLFVPKHVPLSQKMPLALLVSIPVALLTSSEVLPCAHRAQSRYVTGYVEEIPTCSSEQCPLVGTEFLESRVQDTDRGKLQGVCGEAWLESKFQAVHCTLASKKWGALMKHSRRWLLFEQHLFVPKHVTLSQKMPLALLVSIPLALLTSSEVLPCAHRADMSLDMLKKSQLVRASSARLLEQNFLRAGCRTQIEGSCKVYVEKTDWNTSWKLYPCKQEVRSFDEALWQMTPFRAAAVCSKACDTIAEDASSVASQHSSGLIDIKWSASMRPQSRYVSRFVWDIPTCSSEKSHHAMFRLQKGLLVPSHVSLA